MAAAQPASYTGELSDVSPDPASLGLSGVLPAMASPALPCIAGFFIARGAAHLVDAGAVRLIGSLATGAAAMPRDLLKPGPRI